MQPATIAARPSESLGRAASSGVAASSGRAASSGSKVSR
jgi:hypothetical protein